MHHQPPPIPTLKNHSFGREIPLNPPSKGGLRVRICLATRLRIRFPPFEGGLGGISRVFASNITNIRLIVKNLNTTDFHLPYNPNLIDRAKELRKNLTPAEKKLWYDYLRNFKYRVFRQRPIDHFIVDFYCPSLKLVIEVDGDSHFTEEAEAADRERTQILESYGIKVIRFTNQEVLKDFEGVCSRIEAEIPLNLE